MFWLLLGVATSFIALLAVSNGIGALVIFGPWAVVSFALAVRLLLRPPERRALQTSLALAVVSLGLSLLGFGVSPTPDYWLSPIVLAILSGAVVMYSVLALKARPATYQRSSSGGDTIWAQRAALVILFGGLAIVVGSFTRWGACAGIPCEGPMQLFSIWERTGVSFGPGIVTATLGLFILALGIDATRGPGRALPAELPLTAASVVLIVVVCFVVRVHVVPLYKVYPGFEGPILVGLGATAALLASLRQRRTRLREIIE